MNDQELIHLLHHKTPADFTPEELNFLHVRMRESAAVRAAMLQNIHFEAHLATALGGVDLQAEELASRAEQRQRTRSRPLRRVLGLLGMLLLGGVAYVAWQNWPLENLIKPQETETTERIEPVEEQKPPPEQMPEKIDATAPTETVSPPETTPEAAPPMAIADANPASKPAMPWDAIMRLPQDELPRFEEICFRDLALQTSIPQKKELAQWFIAAPGKPLQIVDSEIKPQKVRCGALEGIARLQAPLPADGGLRFAITNCTLLQIHTYSGQRGVTFFYNLAESRDNWDAYATTRKPGTAEPLTLLHTATDDGRASRVELRYGGPLELRWQAGEIVLWRGDIALLRAPLPLAPEEIYFEGNVAFEAIELVRTKDEPPSPPQVSAGEKFRPADLEWSEKLAANAKLERLPEGFVRLSSLDTKDRSLVFAPIPGMGPREVIFEIEQASPGFGVCFGYENGEVRDTARLIQNKKSGRINFTLRPADQFLESDALGRFPEKQEPIASTDRLWIKLLFSAWGLVAWQSADGVHWAIADNTEPSAPPGVTSLGLYLCKMNEAGGGTVKSITVREFPELNSLVPRELLVRAPAFPRERNYESWLVRVTETCPAGVELNAWRRACALRSLGSGCLNYMADPLLEALLEDAAAQGLPFEKQLALLRECQRMTPDWNDRSLMRYGLVTRLQQAAELAARSTNGRPFSLVRRDLMEAPTFSRVVPRIKESENIEREMLHLLQSGHNEALLDFTALLRFFHFEVNHPLLPWAETVARRNEGLGLGDRATPRDRRGRIVRGKGKKDTATKADWQEPFLEELDKEVYNFATDLEALVEGDALADAARMITSLAGDRAGLTPIAEDRSLYVSLRSAARLALAGHPPLLAELNRTSGALAQLRVRQAIAANDAAALELATVQFAGSEAAADAHAWLGDRALQLGWFTRALAEYRHAATTATPVQLRAIKPRMRLAAAMLGQEVGTSGEQPVSFGELRMPPQEFESLVQEMRERGRSAETTSAFAASLPLPAPARLEAARKARLEGAVGQKPEEEGVRFLYPWRIDPVGRQLASEVVGETMYVSNRFQVAAYQRADGKRLWTSQTPSGEIRRTQDWPLLPMRPVVTEQRIYARLLYGPQPTLCCFQRTTGQLVWQLTSSDTEGFASDPFLSQGELLMLACQRMENQWQLQLLHLDPLTGDVLSRRKLVSLRKNWEMRRGCEITPLADGFLAATGGIALHSDLQGNLRWVRKSLFTPQEERPDWVRQYYTPPLVAGDRALFLQPGTEAIECVELDSGRRLWSYSEVHPRRILGSCGELVIAETAEGFVGLEWSTGKVRWQSEEFEPRMVAAALSEQRLLYTVLHEAPNQPRQPTCVWLDATTGRSLGRSPLPELKHEEPRLGPFVVTKDRLWCFAGIDKDPNRDLLELQPREALAKVETAAVRDAWCYRIPQELSQQLREKAPQWCLLSTLSMEKPVVPTEWQGEKNVFGLLSRVDLPIALARTWEIPARQKTTLKLQIGHEPGEEGIFRIGWGEEELLNQPWKPDTQKERWLNLEVDLSRFAGQTGTLTAKYQPTQGNEHTLWVKQIVLESK